MVKKSAIVAFIENVEDDWATSTIVSQLKDFCNGETDMLHDYCQPLLDGEVAHPSDLQTAEAQAVASVG